MLHVLKTNVNSDEQRRWPVGLVIVGSFLTATFNCQPLAALAAFENG
jgi:hypothetical protein